MNIVYVVLFLGIALAMVLDWCIKAALDIWRFRSGKWRNKKII